MAMQDYQTNIDMLPPHMREGMLDYIEKGYAPGGFLMAVLCNDLKGAAGRADSVNQRYLLQYAQYLMWYVPHICWGNEEKVMAWIDQGGMEGRMKG
jgi:hypothetical protein